MHMVLLLLLLLFWLSYYREPDLVDEEGSKARGCARKEAAEEPGNCNNHFFFIPLK